MSNRFTENKPVGAIFYGHSDANSRHIGYVKEIAVNPVGLVRIVRSKKASAKKFLAKRVKCFHSAAPAGMTFLQGMGSPATIYDSDSINVFNYCRHHHGYSFQDDAKAMTDDLKAFGAHMWLSIPDSPATGEHLTGQAEE